MKLFVPAALITTVVLVAACGRGTAAQTRDDTRPRVPVLVELFTSEGCSSCPPADRLLTELISNQPIPGIQVIALGEHVDYWNGLGWRDRFSSQEFTARQSEYRSEVFPTNAIYTPQAVIDGSLECIGSDRPALERAVREAAQQMKAVTSLTAHRVTAGEVAITIGVDIPQAVPRHGTSDIVIAAVEEGLTSRVSRGENRGRTLEHSAVARELRVVGDIADNTRSGSISTILVVPSGWSADSLGIVAFVQERDGRRVLGSAYVTVD